mmetsp:Transcript_106011/g.167397  ORF Transcript_106011/g.167397 Transcript_106011/m.167397 type:complete len:212 (-) Transcript_106011:248-883(-)
MFLQFAQQRLMLLQCWAPNCYQRHRVRHVESADNRAEDCKTTSKRCVRPNVSIWHPVDHAPEVVNATQASMSVDADSVMPIIAMPLRLVSYPISRYIITNLRARDENDHDEDNIRRPNSIDHTRESTGDRWNPFPRKLAEHNDRHHKDRKPITNGNACHRYHAAVMMAWHEFPKSNTVQSRESEPGALIQSRCPIRPNTVAVIIAHPPLAF